MITRIHMIRALIGGLATLALCSLALAQHGTAGPGYFPMSYHGDTWTGEVSAVNDSTREITLLYKDEKHHKSESFVVELPAGYKVKNQKGEDHELKPSEIPIGTRMKVYYLVKSRKVEGRKTSYNELFAMAKAPPKEK